MLSLTNNYNEGKCLGNHPFGKLFVVYKDEYNVHFEKCVIDGVISTDKFKMIRKLKYNSYIVEYEKMTDYILIESIQKLPDQLNEIEIKKMILDLFNAINILQERQLYVDSIQLNSVYKTKNHYKLDCYNVCDTGNYQFLVQQVCYIGLNILKKQNTKFYHLLEVYSNPHFQSSISDMINHLTKTSIKSDNYLLKNISNTRKKNNILIELLYYILLFYPFLPLIIVLLIIILII